MMHNKATLADRYTETNAEVIEKALHCLKHGELESVENWLGLLLERLTENSLADALTDLLPCPFCGQPLHAKVNRPNPSARCVTEGCKGRQLPVLNLDQPADIAAWNTRAASPVDQPAAAPIDEPSVNGTIMFSGDSLTLSGAQLLEALDFIAPDRDADQLESEVTIQYGEGHTGKGMYCWCTDYPEEGAIFIDGSTAVPAAPAPAPSSADERAAFDPRALAESIDSMITEWVESCLRMDLDWHGMADVIEKRINRFAARAASANETGAEGAFHKLLAALIDIYDDERNNAPEDRCYVEGAWTEVIDEARAMLAHAPVIATEVAKVDPAARMDWSDGILRTLPPLDPTIAIEELLSQYGEDDKEEIFESIKAYSDMRARQALSTQYVARSPAMAAEAVAIPSEALLFEHDDGRYAVALTAEDATFAHCEPAWHRVGPVNVPIEHTVVVGDSIWDMLAAARCRALGVGLLAGGYGSDELERAGALRVYDDPADLLWHLDEVAARP